MNSSNWPMSTRSPSTTTPTLSRCPMPIVERIMDGTVDWITLTSSAITERLHELLPERGSPADRTRGPPGESEPGDFGDGGAPGLERRGRGDRIHMGRIGRRPGGANRRGSPRFARRLARLGRRLIDSQARSFQAWLTRRRWMTSGVPEPSRPPATKGTPPPG